MVVNGEAANDDKIAFEALRNTMSLIANSDNSENGLTLSTNPSVAAKLIPADRSSKYGNNAVEINSLIFTPVWSRFSADRSTCGTFAVAIVGSTEKVDVGKLSSQLTKMDGQYSQWELAPSHLVEDLCGFEPGCVPPLGYPRQPMSVVIDESLVTNKMLLGGGGCLDQRCVIRADSLIESTKATVCDIMWRRGRGFEGGMLRQINGDRSNIARIKPFFPVAPPAAESGASYDQTRPHQPVPVTAMGRLISVRQIAKKLVFADLAPPDYPYGVSSAQEKQEQYKKEMPWRSGEDSRDMYVQIIVGKTFCEQFGEKDGPERLKLLKPGRLVLIRGAANVDPNQKNGWANTSGNWAQKRSLDVIISSFEILAEPDEVDDIVSTHMGTLGQLPWERKRGFERRAVASMAPERGKWAEKGVECTDDTVLKGNAPVLTIPQFNSYLRDSPLEVTVVDCSESMETLADSLSSLLSMKGDLLDLVLGIDCEWRPTGKYSDNTDANPVALLQISAPSLSRAFLVDMHALIRSNLTDKETMTPSEQILSDAIGSVFRSVSIIKVGFHVAVDFRRLAASFPHVPAFSILHSVLELSSVAENLHPNSPSRSIGSLRRLCQLVLNYDVSKEQQCSDWEARPLSLEQIEYATLDCALPPRILDEMAEGAGTAKMTAILPSLLSSWRFLTLGGDQVDAISRLEAKRGVGDAFVVSQKWTTGEEAPEIPTVE